MKLVLGGPEGNLAEIVERGTYSIRRVPVLSKDVGNTYLAKERPVNISSGMAISGISAIQLPIIRPTGVFVEGYVLLEKFGEYNLYKESNLPELPSPKEFQKEFHLLAKKHSSISRDHLWICCYDTVRFIDYGSKNGTRIDGKLITDFFLTESGEYDLQLGNVHFNLFFEDDSDISESDPKDEFKEGGKT